MKPFKGKAIYNPTGKAGEYSRWACNFYTGCSNNCDYCYCKRGVLSSTWSDTAKLKKCFKDKDHALWIFKKELLAKLEELRQYGLFFTFTSDPLLEKTIDLTVRAVDICLANNVPVQLLTKRAYWLEGYMPFPFLIKRDLKKLIAFGFTLTGVDAREPGASPNGERIKAIAQLHAAGFKTFASIEPVIDFANSLDVIHRTLGVCDLYKIGLMSGKKYPLKELCDFFYTVNQMKETRIYWKDSVLLPLKFDRNSFEFEGFENIVDCDYNMFSDTSQD